MKTIHNLVLVWLLKPVFLCFLVISIKKAIYITTSSKWKYDFMGWFSKMRASIVSRDPRRNWLRQLRNCTISAFSQNFTPISTTFDTFRAVHGYHHGRRLGIARHLHDMRSALQSGARKNRVSGQRGVFDQIPRMVMVSDNGTHRDNILQIMEELPEC